MQIIITEYNNCIRLIHSIQEHKMNAVNFHNTILALDNSLSLIAREFSKLNNEEIQEKGLDCLEAFLRGIICGEIEQRAKYFSTFIYEEDWQKCLLIASQLAQKNITNYKTVFGEDSLVEQLQAQIFKLTEENKHLRNILKNTIISLQGELQ